MASLSLASSPYTPQRRIRDFIALIPNRLFMFLCIPGFVKPIDYPDIVTGNRIRIMVGLRFTVITVNNRDYYFRRCTGVFDGTGYTICSPSIPEQLDYILADTPVSTLPLSLWDRLKRRLQSKDWGCSE